MIPEMLDGLGIAKDMERLPLVLERGGSVDTVVLQPAGALHAAGHGTGLPIDQRAWVDLADAAAEPLWRRQPDRIYWFAYLPEDRTVYVAYRAVASPPHGPSNREFWDSVFASVDHNQAERLVIDVRENTGGNGFLNRHVVQQILRRPRIDRPDALVVIIGRRTFSAAQQLVNDLDWWTQATFVGEPTGQRPSQFGDHEPLVLPHSGITVQISTVFHQGPDPFDRRAFVAPAVYTPLTSADYDAGRDPAWEAIATLDARESPDRGIEAAVARGDTTLARRLLDSAVTDVANRFRPLEQEVNALGYRLLNAHQSDRAIAVFRLNAAQFPASANVWDSLGEALELVGRRDEAMAAYRKALARDPAYPSSLRALERLGGRRP
jgi:Tetratricopeptide repeat